VKEKKNQLCSDMRWRSYNWRPSRYSPWKDRMYTWELYWNNMVFMLPM